MKSIVVRIPGKVLGKKAYGGRVQKKPALMLKMH